MNLLGSLLGGIDMSEKKVDVNINITNNITIEHLTLALDEESIQRVAACIAKKEQPTAKNPKSATA